MRLHGVAGAAASFIGFGLPAFLLMTTLSALYVRTSHLPAVISAFAGLQAIIVGIIGHATVSFGRTSLNSWGDASIALLAAGMFGWGIHPILVILLTALTGLVLYRQVALPHLPGKATRETRLMGPIVITATVALLP
jgi:chromate transporter